MFYFQSGANNAAANTKKKMPTENNNNKKTSKWNKKKKWNKTNSISSVTYVLVERSQNGNRIPLGAKRIRYDCKTAIIYESNVIGWIKVQSIKRKIKAWNDELNRLQIAQNVCFAFKKIVFFFVVSPQYRPYSRDGGSERKKNQLNRKYRAPSTSEREQEIGAST